MIDRFAISQAVAKAIAYKLAGKDDLACQWARKVVELLRCEGILS